MHLISQFIRPFYGLGFQKAPDDEMVVGLAADFQASKMIVEFFWSLGFARSFVMIYEIMCVALLAILFCTPGMRDDDSFSDGTDFVLSLVWKRPPKKPPDKTCNSNSFRVRFD